MSRQLIREQCSNILTWEKIEQDINGGYHTYRAKVPGGWILRFVNANSHPQDTDYLMVNDPKYAWELPEQKPSE